MPRSPGEPLSRPSAELVAAANDVVPPTPVDTAQELFNCGFIHFNDIREPGEWKKLGIIPGAYRAPRGMLEFWIDPDSPYYRPELDDGRTLMLYCGSAWRSALAAKSLHEMGIENVRHIEGGFTAWKNAGGPIEELSK